MAPTDGPPFTRGPAPSAAHGPLREVALVFLRLGATAFGGPAAHIALFRHEFVGRRRWLSEQRYLDLLGAANLLPGPTSTEMAIAIGRDRAGWSGMLVSGVLFILPASIIVLLLAMLYERFGSLPEVGWLLYGMQPVVVAVVAHAVLGLARAALPSPLTVGVGMGAALLALLRVDPLLLLVAGGVIVTATRFAGSRPDAGALLVSGTAVPDPPGFTGAVAATIGAAAAAAPIAIGLVPLFLLFLKLGLVVFGSGYVLLAFLRADLVAPGIISDRQLLDAVAVGQVTPGPVFTTATFLGYLLAGVPGAVVATVAVFLPSFVLVGLTHPLVSRIRRSAVLGAALDGVTAAALGLMAAVTIELARVAIVDPFTLAAFAGGLIVLVASRVNPVVVLAAGAIAGLAASVVSRLVAQPVVAL